MALSPNSTVGDFGISLTACRSQDFTYVGVTNNVATITFKDAFGATLGVLTFTYVAAGAADDDDVLTITRTT